MLILQKKFIHILSVEMDGSTFCQVRKNDIVEILTNQSLNNNFKFDLPEKIKNNSESSEWEIGITDVVLDLNLNVKNNNIILNSLTNDGIFLESKTYDTPKVLQDEINIQLNRMPFSSLISFNNDLDIILNIYNLSFKYSNEVSLIFDGINSVIEHTPCKKCKISELQFHRPTWLKNPYKVIENKLLINGEKVGQVNIGTNTTESDVVNAFVSNTFELYVYLQIKYNANNNSWTLYLDKSRIKLELDIPLAKEFYGLTLRESFTPNILVIEPNTVFNPFTIKNTRDCYILSNSAILSNSEHSNKFKIIPLYQEKDHRISFSRITDRLMYFQLNKEKYNKTFSIKIHDINGELLKLSDTGYSKICAAFHYREIQ